MVALNDPVFVTARILAPCVSVLFVLVNQGKQHWLYLDMMDVRYNLPISDDHQTINAGYSTRSSPHIDWHTLNDTNMSYAPYQDESNEPDAPLERDPTARQQTPYADDVTQGINVQSGAGFGNGLGADERNPDPFSTSLPMRLEIEASLAYLGLPPAGGAILLMMEHKNDYVRFHAWQSSLLFTCLFGLHIIFSFTAVISYILLVVDLVLVAFLTLHAYKDADSLSRFELPWFGRMASSFVDTE